MIVERPTYDRPRAIMHAEGREFSAVGIDAEGLDLDELEQVCSEGSPPALLYTIPTFQNPSGVTLSEERRRVLASFARERSLPVLEDDPVRPRPLRGRAAAEPVRARGRGASSCTAPRSRRRSRRGCASATRSSLRSWRRSSCRWRPRRTSRPRSRRRRRCTSSCAEGCSRRTSSGSAASCASGATRCSRLSRASSAGGRRWSRPEGGYFLWLELPEDVDAAELLERSSEAGVTFVPGADFGGAANTARLAFSYVSPDEIDEGVRLLGAATGGVAGGGRAGIAARRRGARSRG